MNDQDEVTELVEPGIDELPLLLVDDDPEVLTALCRTLAHRGWGIAAASSSAEALERMERQEFAAVVCDYRMPGMDGVELLSLVRARSPHSERILLTASADEEALERGVNDAGIHRLMRKPWHTKALLAVLEQAIRDNRIRREHAVLFERVRNRNAELSYLNQILRDRVAESDRTIMTFHRRWDAALNAISEPLLIISADLCVEGTNLTGARLARRPSELLEGLKCYNALFGGQVPCSGCPIGSGFGRIRVARDGLERVFDARAYALPGSSPGYICSYTDVTEKLLFEREAAHMEKMAAIGRVAGSVAHELNNPLHAILTFTQLAQKPEVCSEKLTRYHEVIRESAIRCRDIVSSLRNFARRDGSFDKMVVDLHSISDRVLMLFTATHGSKQIERLPCGEGAACCFGNANQLHQVVVNLIQNALDATPERGRIQVCVGLDGQEVLLAVDDEGPGVPLAVRDKIFEPFFTTKPEGVGTGLGLAISHQIVGDHGGTIRVSTSPLGGARFEVRLPCCKLEQDQQEVRDGTERQG